VYIWGRLPKGYLGVLVPSLPLELLLQPMARPRAFPRKAASARRRKDVADVMMMPPYQIISVDG
jgi:hypothetical protein